MNTKNIVTSIVISVIVVFLGFTIFGGKTTERVIVEKDGTRTVVGAVSTLDNVDLPYVSIGGNQQYYYSQRMFATSSVVCSIKNPFNASSTLASYGFSVTSNGIASAQSLGLSTSTSAYGSSTPSYIRAFPAPASAFAGTWGGVIATSTGAAGVIGMSGTATWGSTGQSDNIIGPSEYMNLRLSTTSAGTYPLYYTGTCSGVIEKL
jgi:hypothetical protein